MYKHSTFSKILKQLDRNIVEKAVKKYNSDKYNKGFCTWSQLVAMIFSQITDCKSLRDLEIRYNAGSNKHKQLGVRAVKRSTISEANKKRDSRVFQEIATRLIRGQGKGIGSVISLIDSSMIRVSGRGTEWTKATETRCGKGLKLHIQCESKSKILQDISISNSNVNDISEARNFELEEGKIYVFDKGYLDYNWWFKIDRAKAYFVTRIKKNTAYRVIEERKVRKEAANIISDQIIELTNKNPGGGRKNLLVGKALRLVEVYDHERKRIYQFISNLLDEEASEISEYYKQRWGVELLFKWLKQNLKLKKFLAENENAIKIQIYAAIIAYVLIGMFKKLCTGVFIRSIDLLSWIKMTIFSDYRLPKIPQKT